MVSFSSLPRIGHEPEDCAGNADDRDGDTSLFGPKQIEPIGRLEHTEHGNADIAPSMNSFCGFSESASTR
jgi:hypothetical protein